MKKFFLPIFFIFSIFIASCSKSNDNEILIGSFTQNSAVTSELYSDPEDINTFFGNCTVNSSITLTFNEDSSYSLSIKQYLDECSLNEDAGYAKEDLEAFFKRKLLIKGTYNASGDELTLLNKKVVSSDGTEFYFDEYKVQDPTIGEKTQKVNFRLTEDSLVLEQNGTSVTYKKNKD